MKNRVISMLFGLMLLLSINLPLQAKPVQYPVGTAQVSFVLFVDGNSNGYLDYTGTDVCVLSNNDGSMLAWEAQRSSNQVTYLVYTPYGTDFTVNSYTAYLNCVNSGRKMDIPSDSYYDLYGCGPYPKHVWVGYTQQGQILTVEKRTNATEPSC